MSMKIAGIDEAGRGAILASLHLAIVMSDKKTINEFKKMGIRDSKLLTPGRREQLASKIKKMADYGLVKVSPDKIDSRFSDGSNLNWLEGRKMAELINTHKPDVVYIDCPSVNLKKFKGFLKARLDYNPKLVVEHKADQNYPVVGAASIIAKVSRDSEIAKLSKKIGIYCGSGYSSDPIAIKAVKKMIHTPLEKHIRKSWYTYSRIKEEKEQRKLGDFK